MIIVRRVTLISRNIFVSVDMKEKTIVIIDSGEGPLSKPDIVIISDSDESESEEDNTKVA